jgi:hypothetical protein
MRILPCIALIGCGFGEKRFEVVGIERICEQASACAGTYDAAACVDALRTTDRSECDYDPAAAKACANTVEEARCVAREPFAVQELELPEDCQAAYDCPGADGGWIDLSGI